MNCNFTTSRCTYCHATGYINSKDGDICPSCKRNTIKVIRVINADTDSIRQAVFGEIK